MIKKLCQKYRIQDSNKWNCSSVTLTAIAYVYYVYCWIPTLSDRLKFKYLLHQGD